ncbi:MAG: acyl-CoA synthetase [Proteobacteria bacterium]|nr:acyl-CoA synthetase [Pseudomonadota bacterium]
MGEIKIASIKDIEEIEKVPFDERLRATNTYDLIKQGATIDPDAKAISFIMSGDLYESPMEITYAEFMAQINRTANLFHDLGIGPRDVVSYLLPNTPHTHYTLWGGEAAGIVNPINSLLEASTIRDICLATGTKVLVALGEMEGADIWQKVEAIRHDLPDLKAIVRVFGPSDEKNGIYGFDEVVPKYDGDKLDSGRIFDSQDICSMYHTGGTTGTPKLAPHTHYNEVAMVELMNLAGLLKTGETLMCGLPLFHVNGTMVTGGFPFSIGAHVVILSPQGYRDPTVIKNFYKIVERYKPAFFSCVPTVLSTLLDIPKENENISSLQFALCGAAPLSVELMQRFESRTDMKVLEGYGLTEGTTASSINPAFGERKTGSIGLRLPYNEMKVFVKNGDRAREAETDEIGAICIKGPNVFRGYLDESKNADIWMKKGWFNTGDLGRQDADGYFWLTGREKDLIIRGGHNIDPAVIEEPLYRLEGVQVAAAVGRPDSHAGEVPVAFVQLQQGTDLTPEKISEYLKNEIGERAAVPKEVFIVDTIPLTPVGKIFKPSLRWNAVDQVYRQELKSLGTIIESVEVKTSEDKIHGSLTTISVKPAPNASQDEIKEKVAEKLARYTIKHQLLFV